jgi:HK97 family phage portal protein
MIRQLFQKVFGTSSDDATVEGVVPTADIKIQSVDQLVSILAQATNQQGMTLKLSDVQARKQFVRWQFAACSALADAVMTAEWGVQEKRGDKWEAVEESKLEALLRRPNPLMTGAELIWWTVVELAMIGKSWWFLPENGAGDVAEIIPLTGTVKPTFARGDDPRNRILSGWKQEWYDNGQMRSSDYDADEIVYFKTPKPGALLDGQGAMQAAGSSVKLDSAIMESAWASFKRGVMPSVVLKMRENDPDKRRKAVEEFDKRFAGTSKSGAAIPVNANLVDLDWIGNKPKEMGYEKSAEARRDEILGVMRTPAAILGITKETNRANIQGAEYIWGKWRVWPFVTMLRERMNTDLAPKIDEGRRVEFDRNSIIPKDAEQDRKQQATDVSGGVLTINEVRQSRGREPVPWGEEPWLSANKAQPSMLSIDKGPSRGEEQESPEPEPDHRHIHRQSSVEDARLQARYMMERASFEQEYGVVISRYFERLGKRVLAAMDKVGRTLLESGEVVTLQDSEVFRPLPDNVDALLTPEQMAEDMANYTAPKNKQGVYLGGKFDRSVLGEDVPWEPTMDRIQEFADRYDADHFLGVAQVTRTRMVETVNKAIQKHETYEELRARVVTEFGAMSKGRADNIAVTETTKLWNAGGQAFRDEYEVPFKRWICSFINSRATHVEADGQTVKNDENFQVGADEMPFPGEGSLARENCNCFCIAVATRKRMDT